MKINKGAKKEFFIILFISGILLFIGTLFFVNELASIGQDWLTQQPVVYGGEYYIMVGFIFLVCAYFQLSQHSSIREFFEGSIEIRNRKGRKKSNKSSKKF